MKTFVSVGVVIAIAVMAKHAAGQLIEGANHGAPTSGYGLAASADLHRGVAELWRGNESFQPGSPLAPSFLAPRDGSSYSPDSIREKNEKFVEKYFQRRQANRFERIGPRSLTPGEIISPNEKLKWPVVLLHAHFDPQRSAIESLRDRGGMSTPEMLSLISALEAKLREFVRGLSPAEYIAARRYLLSLKAAAEAAPKVQPMQATIGGERPSLNWPAALRSESFERERRLIEKLAIAADDFRRLDQMVGRMESQLAQTAFQVSPAEYREAQEFLHELCR